MHEIHIFKYGMNVSKEHIVSECNEIAERNSDGGGLYRGIKFIDREFDDEEEMEHWLYNQDDYWNGSAILNVYDYEETRSSKSLTTKIAKLETLLNKLTDDLKNAQTFKTKFVTCEHCQSKLATSYLNNKPYSKNICCVCNKTISSTTQNKINTVQVKINNTQQQIKDLNKQKTNAMKRTLKKQVRCVKIEYHC